MQEETVKNTVRDETKKYLFRNEQIIRRNE